MLMYPVGGIDLLTLKKGDYFVCLQQDVMIERYNDQYWLKNKRYVESGAIYCSDPAQGLSAHSRGAQIVQVFIGT
jgi:hypothetical protein